MMVASNETTAGMGFKFSTAHAGTEQLEPTPGFPGPAEVKDRGGWSKIVGSGPRAQCPLTGWRGSRPPNHTRASSAPFTPPPRMPTWGPAFALQPSREAKGTRQPAVGARSGCARVNVIGSAGTQSCLAGERRKKRALTELSNFPTPFKCRFSWVDLSLSLWCPTWTIRLACADGNEKPTAFPPGVQADSRAG